MKVTKIFALFVLMIMLSSFVLAAMPEDHTEYNVVSMEEFKNTAVGKVVNKYPQDFLACDLMADISVFYYFSEGFTSIGKEYKATHSTVLCTKMVELAGNDEKALACAYGVCAHHVQDSIYHNIGVPAAIEATGLPNGIVHAFWEEKMNKEVDTPELRAKVNDALTYVKDSQHKEEFRKALIATGSTLPFDSMWDKFVTTVVGNGKYSPGFQGFTAIPMSIHFMLIIILIGGFALMFYLIKLKKNSMPLDILKTADIMVIGIIILVYILFFTNTLWQAFEFVSTPVTWFIPAGNEASVRMLAQDGTNNLFIYGANYINVIQNPSGAESLAAADAANVGIKTVFALGFIGMLLFIAATIITVVFKKITNSGGK